MVQNMQSSAQEGENRTHARPNTLQYQTPMPLTHLWSECSPRLRRVTRATSRNLAGLATRFYPPFHLKIQCMSTPRQPSSVNAPYSGSGITAVRWLDHPPRSAPTTLRGGSASSSKLVRDDPYPYPYSLRPFIRSRKADDEDPDADEYDPELALDLDDASERRGSGSGGTSGTSVYDDDGPPREGNIFATERCGRTGRVGGERVDVPVLLRG